MSNSGLGHPASRVKGRPSAPPSLLVTVTVDGCMFITVGLLAFIDAPWWSFLVPPAIGAPVLVVYGRRAAAAMGIRYRDETPHGWLLALAIPGGLAGVLAAHAGRYGGFVVMAYIILAHTGERIAWARFRANSL